MNSYVHHFNSISGGFIGQLGWGQARIKVNIS